MFYTIVSFVCWEGGRYVQSYACVSVSFCIYFLCAYSYKYLDINFLRISHFLMLMYLEKDRFFSIFVRKYM